MKLQLKSINVMHQMSRGSWCFSSKLYKDGKPIAHISNHGDGGADKVEPITPATWETIREVESWIAANNPTRSGSLGGTPLELHDTLELWVGREITIHLTIKDLRRWFKKNVVVLQPKEDGETDVLHYSNGQKLTAEVLAKFVAENPKLNILNVVPDIRDAAKQLIAVSSK